MARWEPTLADVDHALKVVAFVIKNHPLGRKALPIFERLERERERLAREVEAMERVEAVLAAAGPAFNPHSRSRGDNGARRPPKHWRRRSGANA